ncbi:MAG TPA: (E)-4-hydroxy-3-methylbut-2-enyl-diphosphate synthase [Flavitalea sp.]|nr:(E)-4-hydroxy-3-methylbut-2-enyl-diphosphate synthase [Flavitalea sp.]
MEGYCESLTDYQRLRTIEVKIGDLSLGNFHPVRIQTMTTTDTMDTQGTIEQSIRCIDAGAELIRITAPSKKEAENLQLIKDGLRKRGYDTPLVADIHFTPNAAEIAARIVEKVRVNPGNYVDKKKFAFIEYTDAAYREEMERIRERFTPLVKICKEYGTAMRIGTNHGSLSDRIMSRYGDTAMGMVESAMEFLRISRDEDYHNIALSMKSSNPLVMAQAYRLLVQTMHNEFGVIYPLHLGVTEAGDGEDGRIKSAIGIGALMEDGIGDTIRVSLTEDPEFEIPVCRDLVKRYARREAEARRLNAARTPALAGNALDGAAFTGDQDLPGPRHPGPADSLTSAGKPVLPYSPFQYLRRETTVLGSIGGKQPPAVVADFSRSATIGPEDLKAIGYRYDPVIDKWNISDGAADLISTGNKILDFSLPGTLQAICHYTTWFTAADKQKYHPFIEAGEYLSETNYSALAGASMVFVELDVNDEGLAKKMLDFLDKGNGISTAGRAALCLRSSYYHSMASIRQFIIALMHRGIRIPAFLVIESDDTSIDEQLIHFSANAGALLLDGMGDGIWLKNDPSLLNTSRVSGRTYLEAKNNAQFINNTSFSILQATRTRISKTEYISCPSCGRTLFDLQETTAKIRAVTHHLKGVKIAIMGCIVNGPGEMADADFGYVGSGPGKITLYKGKEVVKRAVNSDIAVEELINLLKENGAWVEPEP